MLKKTGALLLLLILFSPDIRASAIKTTPCPIPVPLDQDIECGFLEVPEDRSKPEDRKIQEDGVQYRILGAPDAKLKPKPATPTLEDGYMWLMNGLHQS